MTARRHVLVVADDLTGANATAARFARASLRSATVNYTSIHEVVRQFDAIIVSTESRHAEPEHAADRVRHVIAQFPDATLVVKRVDTTLRGNIGSETAAVLDQVRQHRPGERVRALIVPAYPTSGRVTVDGHQLLNGKPLEQTELRYDPQNPMTTSSIRRIVECQSELTARNVSLGRVISDQDALLAALLEGDKDAVICDAMEESHIDLIASAAARATTEHGVQWVSVDPGPAGALLAHHLGLDQNEQQSLPPQLAVVGSATDLSVRQTEYLAGSDLVTVLEVDCHALTAGTPGSSEEQAAVSDLARQIGDGLSALRFPRQLLVRTLGKADVSARISQADGRRLPGLLAAAVHQAIVQTPVSGLYTSGGDVTAAVLEIAEVHAFEVIGEVIPLAVYGLVVGGSLDGLPVVTKGGLIGADDTAEACMNQLRTLAENRARNNR